MGVKLSEIEEGSSITLLINNEGKSMEMGAILKKHVKENIALITIQYDTTRTLVFDNVQVDLEYGQENDVPIAWHDIKVVNYKSADYVMQVFADGTKHNRRDSFRVGIATTARLHMSKPGPSHVMVRDLSLSGFSITDRKKELKLDKGDLLSIAFEDFGYIINLDGKVVRIQDSEDMTIYGLQICNLCKDLAPYVSQKQRRNRSK